MGIQFYIVNQQTPLLITMLRIATFATLMAVAMTLPASPYPQNGDKLFDVEESETGSVYGILQFELPSVDIENRMQTFTYGGDANHGLFIEVEYEHPALNRFYGSVYQPEFPL